MGTKYDRERELAARRAKKKYAREVALRTARAGARPESTDRELSRPWRPYAEGVDAYARRTGGYPYQALREVERIFAAMPGDVRPRFWSRAAVDGLTTEEIVARLAMLDIETDRARFCALARPQESAWAISRLDWPTRALPPIDADFAGVAAWILWQRWCPEQSCVEQLLEPYEDARELHAEEGGPRAIAASLAFWAALRARLTPELRTHEAVTEEVVELDLDTWLTDLLDDVVSLSQPEPVVVRAVVRALIQWCEQFDAEPVEVVAQVADILEELMELIEPERMEALLREELAHAPDEAEWPTRVARLILRGEALEPEQLEEVAALIASARRCADADPEELEHLEEQLLAARERAMGSQQS